MLYLYYRTTFVPVRKYISLPLEINKHYMAIKRFGVSLEENLLESLDKYVDENGFANRSQAIRFLVEKNVAEQKRTWPKGNGSVTISLPVLLL